MIKLSVEKSRLVGGATVPEQQIKMINEDVAMTTVNDEVIASDNEEKDMEDEDGDNNKRNNIFIVNNEQLDVYNTLLDDVVKL